MGVKESGEHERVSEEIIEAHFKISCLNHQYGTIRTVSTTYAAALKTTTHPKTRCRKLYAATQHLILLMMSDVPDTCRAKNTAIKLTSCIKLVFQFISWGRCTVKQPSSVATNANYQKHVERGVYSELRPRPACDIFTTQIWRVALALARCASCPCAETIKIF